MSKENVMLIEGLYKGFSAGDISDVLGRMSPSIVWNEAENFPYADGNPYTGPQAVAGGVFARIGMDWNGFTVAVDEIIDAGNTIVALGRYIGTSKATGKSMRTQMVHVWRLADGKVVRFQEYADTLQVARALGSV